MQCVENGSLAQKLYEENIVPLADSLDDMKRLCVIFFSSGIEDLHDFLVLCFLFFFAELHFRSIKQHFSYLVFYSVGRIEFFSFWSYGVTNGGEFFWFIRC